MLAGIGLVGAIWLIAASRWIVTDTVVPWDSKNQFYAFFRFLAATVHSGISPFWNPYHYGGHPSVADPQSRIFAPLFVLWSLFDGAPSLRTFDLLVFGHLLIGALAIAVIGWRARWPVAGCVLAAAVFMFGGAAAARLSHTGIILSYGLFPLALLLLQLALDRRSITTAVGFAVVASVLMLGRNQVALLFSFMLMAVVVGEIATSGQPLRYLGSRAATLVTMGMVGFALVALPLLLTLQFAVLSNRPQEALDTALKASLHPANLAQLMVADIFESHGQYWGPGPASVPELAYTDEAFNYMFVGSVPIVLLLWLGIAGAGAFKRGRLVLTGTLAGALVYALGRYTPFFSWAFDWIPGVAKFRRPVDANFVFVAVLALLSGHLLADYVREGLPRRRVAATVAVAAAAAAMVGSGLLFLERSGHARFGLVEVLRTAPVPIAVVAMLALARTPRARVIVAGVVALIAVSDLMWWNVAFRLNAERRASYAVLEQPQSADALAIDLLERAIRDRQLAGERPRIEVVGMGGPWQNLAIVRGLEATNGYNPLRIGLYDRLISPGESNWLLELRDFPGSFDGYDCALARALGLEFVVLGRPIEQMPHLPRRPVADVLQAGPNVWIYRLRDAESRLKFTRRIRVTDTDAAGAGGRLLESPSPERVLIDQSTPPAHRYDVDAIASPGHARIVAWRPDRIEIEVHGDLGGVLVLHDTWYPGWIAEIDGVRAPILRADVLFRGVEVAPGRHHVTFRFVPFALDNLRDAINLVLHQHDLDASRNSR